MTSIYELTDGIPAVSVMSAFDAATDSVQGGLALVAPVKGLITRVLYVPSAAVTANASNFRVLTLQNKGTNGLSGSTAVASRTWAAGNSVQSQADVFTLSGTAANLQVQAGDVFQMAGTHGGTGLIIPAGSVIMFVAPHL